MTKKDVTVESPITPEEGVKIEINLTKEDLTLIAQSEAETELYEARKETKTRLSRVADELAKEHKKMTGILNIGMATIHPRHEDLSNVLKGMGEEVMSQRIRTLYRLTEDDEDVTLNDGTVVSAASGECYIGETITLNWRRPMDEESDRRHSWQAAHSMLIQRPLTEEEAGVQQAINVLVEEKGALEDRALQIAEAISEIPRMLRKKGADVAKHIMKLTGAGKELMGIISDKNLLE